MRKLAATAEAGVGRSRRSAKRLAHESSEKHVRGTAAYVDDVPVPAGTLVRCDRLGPRCSRQWPEAGS